MSATKEAIPGAIPGGSCLFIGLSMPIRTTTLYAKDILNLIDQVKLWQNTTAFRGEMINMTPRSILIKFLSSPRPPVTSLELNCRPRHQGGK